MQEFRFRVDKYAFASLKMYEEVKKEIDAISYMRNNSDITQVKHAYQLYHKLNEKPSFQTEVGMEFMRELYEIIATSGKISRENIPPIKVRICNPCSIESKDEQVRNTYIANEKGKAAGRTQKEKNLWIVNLFLIGMIAAMLWISRYGDFSHISDYREQIQNEYASWEEELTQREQEISKREKELEMNK